MTELDDPDRKRANGRRPSVPMTLEEVPPDDPATNTFYGPPPRLGEPLLRWSRPWFEWRETGDHPFPGGSRPS